MEDKSTRRNSNSQLKEIEKYLKFFVLKSLQAVVLSRNGTLNKTKCNPSAKGKDWFNICLPDSEVNRLLQNKIRELFGKKVPALNYPIVLDIILKTSEGSYIVLESWQISTNMNIKESYHKNHFSIYNQLGAMIKSMLVISKVLPTFKLSRKAGKDFSLLFKVHTEIYLLRQFQLDSSLCIGSVNTPLCKLNVNVMYRNTIWQSGSFHPHAYRIIDPESLVQLLMDRENIKASFQSIDMFENELALAVSDTGVGHEWFSKLSINSPRSLHQQKDELYNRAVSDFYSGATIGHETGSQQIAAFVEPGSLEDLNSLDLPKLPPIAPFQSLFEDKEIDPNNQTVDSISLDHLKDINKLTKNEDNSVVPRRAEAVGFEDDFVLVELRPAFFSEDESVGNLYRQCLSPPPLEIFSSLEHEDNESECVDLDTQLERCQKELEEYKEFFSDLQ